MKIWISSRRTPCRGFTLTELALVLLAVTTIVSAIWVAGEHVWDNYRIYRVDQQIMSSVQNIREQYGATYITWPWALGSDKTGTFDAAGLLPVEMRRDPSVPAGTSNIDHALNNTIAGGSFHVFVVNNLAGTTLNAFRLQLLGISQAACIKILMAQPYADGSIGFIQIGTQLSGGTGTTIPIYNGATATGIAYVMTTTTAQALCDDASNSNEIDFDFALHN